MGGELGSGVSVRGDTRRLHSTVRELIEAVLHTDPREKHALQAQGEAGGVQAHVLNQG